ncbi:uncharacterized protein LOC129789330 isoform X2 [Lutzomyia longipalpis]|uniref:uncharacterized protein LOC129789330 isoform X2 n=1 Tax=Lutzomyia longipalpis TaxID=7200 RepID=UPI0024840AF1|nr:uncharacterized protein LOC129789330 isoform X2 [Lutzomyia longipalpis]
MGVRAPNGKVYPNQAQRHLLRKFIAEKQEQCIEAGIKPIRFKLVDFRKWAPELNKLGPPLRSAPKWKNCWFYHKKKRNFYDFFYEKLRQDSHAEKEVCGEKLSKKRNVSGKVQQRKFIELLKQKRQESIAKGDEVTILTTQDFENWTEILNKLGQEYPVEKWKMTWKCMKQRKKASLHFNPGDFKYFKEVGCGSSDEFYLSDDDSAEDIEDVLIKESNNKDEKNRQINSSEDAILLGDDLNKIYLNLCRICLKKRKIMKCFIEGSYMNISYLDIYHECIGEAFKLYDFCSMKICDLCEKSLIISYQFRGICLQTDTQLSYIENYKEKSLNSIENTSEEEFKMQRKLISEEESDISSELEAFEEKSIPEEIMLSLDSLKEKNIFLDMENPLQELHKGSQDAGNIIKNIPENQKILKNKSYTKNLKLKSGISQISPNDSNSDKEKDTDSKSSNNAKEVNDFFNQTDSLVKTRRLERERPNKKQIALLRKLVSEKQANCKRFAVLDDRPVISDFKRWTSQLNALGPPKRSLQKWKDCWFIHKKKKNGFFEFINRRRRKSEIGIELKRISNSPNARGKMNKKQLEILEKFIQERKTNSTGDKVQIYTKDFIDLRKTLNKLGPPYRTVNEWKYTWRHTKKNAKKNPKNNFAIDVQELGCESSDAYYFTNESSDFSSDSELQTTSSITGTNENFGENKDSSDSCTD